MQSSVPDPRDLQVQGVDPFEDSGPTEPSSADVIQNVPIDQQLQSVPAIGAKQLNPDNLDLTTLEPDTLDAAFHYRFVHNSPAKISKRIRRGWSFGRKSEGVRKQFDNQQEGVDDFIYDGDTVLMKIPKDLHEAQRQRVAEVSRSRLAAPKGQFRKKTASSGVRMASKSYRSEPS